jgi:hypothetical protein
MPFREFIGQRMTRARRVKVALSLGAVILFALYAPYIFRGYIRWALFPVLSFFTDLPHCPRCDHLAVHSPLLEWLLISIPIYWSCLGIARRQKKARLKAYLKQNV